MISTLLTTSSFSLVFIQIVLLTAVQKAPLISITQKVCIFVDLDFEFLQRVWFVLTWIECIREGMLHQCSVNFSRRSDCYNWSNWFRFTVSLHESVTSQSFQCWSRGGGCGNNFIVVLLVVFGKGLLAPFGTCTQNERPNICKRVKNGRWVLRKHS